MRRKYHSHRSRLNVNFASNTLEICTEIPIILKHCLPLKTFNLTLLQS